jgi:ribonuclease H2 subunit C
MRLRTGVIVKSTEEYLPQPTKAQSGPTYTALDDDIEIEDEEDEPLEPVKVLDELSSFDEIVVWGHDQLPDLDDPFVRGVEEWIAFAEALHGKAPVQEGKVTGDSDEESKKAHVLKS